MRSAFDASSIKLFRDANAGGKPRTPRVAGGFSGAPDKNASESVYGERRLIRCPRSSRFRRTEHLDSKEARFSLAPLSPQSVRRADAPQTTVAALTERGHSSCSADQPAGCVYKLVTPAVRAAAQRHFGCGSLQGAELENQDTGAGVAASHWEMRLFNSELMNPFSMCVCAQRRNAD